MDFLKILKSLEALLYEVITWLLFFPRTFWWVIRRPRVMAAYVERELGMDADIQFDDALSPPLFLMLAVLLAHTVELGMHVQVHAAGALSRTLLGNEQNLLLYRSITFAVWPLIATLHVLRSGGARLTRETMRRPFYVQCYLAAPFAVTISTAWVFIRLPGAVSTWIGLCVAGLACLWYVIVQARWLQAELHLGRLQTLRSTVWVLFAGLAINSALALLLVAW